MILLEGTYNGSKKSAELNSLYFSGYWADADGNKIDKISFGSKVRFYAEKWWAYNVEIRIFLKPENGKEVEIKSDSIQNLIPLYFLKKERCFEIQLGEKSEYEELKEVKDVALCCGVSNGFGWFYKQDEVAKIEIEQYAIIFPLLKKPLNDSGRTLYENYQWNAPAANNSAAYSSSRKNGRKHAGRDLYGDALKTIVVAICDGEILSSNFFYNKTNEISILHTANDGRIFIARYGEVDPHSVKVIRGQKVKQGDEIAMIGSLAPSIIIDNTTTNMLHFEVYTGDAGYDITEYPLTDRNSLNKFQRRFDIIDPLSILTEGYTNTFNKKQR